MKIILKSDFYYESEFLRTLKDVQKWIKKKTGKSGFFDPLKMLIYRTLYIIVYGERSNGKTFGSLLCAIIRYFLYGELFAYVRRWDEDFRPKAISRLFGGLEKLGVIAYLSGGEWNHIVHRSRMFYLATYDEDGKEILSETPIGYGFALTQMEHDKGGTYPPNVTTIVFDEFLTRGMYLPDEMALFANVLSTVLRDDGQAKIWMLGNTVSKYCPYFREMGLIHIREMEIGGIQEYTGTREDCTIVVHWADGVPNGKETDKYFAFDNPKLKMITEGRFETAIYPHCPFDLSTAEIVFTFFVWFADDILRGDVIVHDGCEFIMFVPKTTELKYPDDELIYSDKYDSRMNWRRRITRPMTKPEHAILDLIRAEKVFYADNETGEIMRNYLQWCVSEKIV